MCTRALRETIVESTASIVRLALVIARAPATVLAVPESGPRAVARKTPSTPRPALDCRSVPTRLDSQSTLK